VGEPALPSSRRLTGLLRRETPPFRLRSDCTEPTEETSARTKKRRRGGQRPANAVTKRPAAAAAAAAGPE
jgi:hypothetical protein